MMASAVYPHQSAKWCRFLDVPPDFEKVARACAGWDAFELKDAANDAGLPACEDRSPQEWLAHPQGADVLNATRPNDFEHDWVYFEADIGSRSA